MTGPTKGLGGVRKEVGRMEEEVKEAYEIILHVSFNGDLVSLSLVDRRLTSAIL
jgi:hypothetical protein